MKKKKKKKNGTSTDECSSSVGLEEPKNGPSPYLNWDSNLW